MMSLTTPVMTEGAPQSPAGVASGSPQAPTSIAAAAPAAAGDPPALSPTQPPAPVNLQPAVTVVAAAQYSQPPAALVDPNGTGGGMTPVTTHIQAPPHPSIHNMAKGHRPPPTYPPSYQGPYYLQSQQQHAAAVAAAVQHQNAQTLGGVQSKDPRMQISYSGDHARFNRRQMDMGDSAAYANSEYPDHKYKMGNMQVESRYGSQQRKAAAQQAAAAAALHAAAGDMHAQYQQQYLHQQQFAHNPLTLHQAYARGPPPSLSGAGHYTYRNHQTATAGYHRMTNNLIDTSLNPNSLTPTVSINSLAMKLGLEAKYTVKEVQYLHQNPPPPTQFDPSIGAGGVGPKSTGVVTPVTNGAVPPPALPPPAPQMASAGVRYTSPSQFFPAGMVPEMNVAPQSSSMHVNHQNRSRAQKPRLYTVVLQIADKEFEGQGKSQQAARHVAAAKALEEFQRNPPQPGNSANMLDGSAQAAANARPKSDISMVYEFAHRLNMPVSFEETCEEGLPSARLFTVKCRVGEHQSEGSGPGKKSAHRLAAKRMLEKLKNIDIPPPRPKNPLYANRPKRKPVRSEKSDDENTMNPISRLVQIMQGQKFKSPVFVVKSQINGRRSREFHVEVIVGEKRAEGHGTSKRQAKQAAAVAMLQSLGYPVDQKVLQQSAMYSPSEDDPDIAGAMMRVTFQDGSNGLLPGAIHILSKSNPDDNGHANGCVAGPNGILGARQLAIKIAREFQEAGNSESADAALKENGADVNKLNPMATTHRPSDKMRILCAATGANLQFHDITKMSAESVEHSSRLHMRLGKLFETEGFGETCEAARDNASQSALDLIAAASPTAPPPDSPIPTPPTAGALQDGYLPPDETAEPLPLTGAQDPEPPKSTEGSPAVDISPREPSEPTSLLEAQSEQPQSSAAASEPTPLS